MFSLILHTQLFLQFPKVLKKVINQFLGGCCILKMLLKMTALNTLYQ